jgi:hypothetical protein
MSENNGYRGQKVGLLEREKRAIEKQIEGIAEEQRLRGWPTDDETASQDRHVARLIQLINDINHEIERQRIQTVAREQEWEERRNRKRDGAQSQHSDMGSAFIDWLQKLQFSSPNDITLNWTLQDIQYSGRFNTKSGILEASIVVPSGTPGAIKRGGRYFLPCNNAQEQRAAIVAIGKNSTK